MHCSAQVGKAAKDVKDYDKKHNISGQVASGIKKGMDGITKALAPKEK